MSKQRPRRSKASVGYPGGISDQATLNNWEFRSWFFRISKSQKDVKVCDATAFPDWHRLRPLSRGGRVRPDQKVPVEVVNIDDDDLVTNKGKHGMVYRVVVEQVTPCTTGALTKNAYFRPQSP